MSRRSLSRTRVRIAVWIAMAVFGVSAARQARAGAWTPQGGHGQIIVTSSLYRTSTTFDASGNTQSFGYGGDFRQFMTSAFLEVRLPGPNTLVFNAPVEFLDFSNYYGKMTSSGAGDVEVAWKRQLNSLESRWAVSGQVLVMFPAYSASKNPAPGNHQEDIEGRFMVGHGAPFAKRHTFWDAEAAYRYRSGAPADQVRCDGTAGIELSNRIMVMGQFFAIKGMRNGEPITANSNPNAQSDFDLYKYQPSLVVALFRGMRVQAGWNDAFSGRNTGRGTTTILGIWKTF